MFRVSNILTALIILGALWFFWPFGKLEDEVAVAPPEPAGSSLATNPAPAKDRAPGATPDSEIEPQDLAAGSGDEARKTTLLRPKRFYKVVVQDGGSLKAGGTTIALAEINVEGLTGQCTDSRKQVWPCGRAARSALMRLIRGRAVMCHVPATGSAEMLTARCSVGGTDLSFWMIAQGWAQARQPAQAAFSEAEAAARERRLGIWR